MCPTKTLAETLWEIYRGDSGPLPADGAKDRLHAAEDGMVSLVTVIAVLFFLVLIGLIANAARVTNQKVEVQNSADAVAYSSALCMARNMNAVTAANHVMGELTAIAALIDALNGDDRSQGNGGSTPDSQALNTQIQTASTAVQALDSAPPYSLVRATRESVVQLVTQPGNDGSATIYDAKLTLKYWTWYAIVVEGLGIVADAVPVIGPILGTGLVFVAEAAYAKIEQEWVFLNGLQAIAGMLRTVSAAMDLMIPLIHISAVAVVTEAPLTIQPAVKTVSEANHVTGAVYPPPLELRLPVVPESSPQNGQDTYSPSQTLPTIAQDLVNAVNGAGRLLNSATSLLGDAAGALGKALGGGKGGNPLQKLQDFAGALNGFGPPQGPTGEGYKTYNPSQKPFEDLKIDQATERYSQWVRATYPWVTAWRAPVRGAMDDLLTFSMASLWYSNWTNKYTLARAHRYRTDSGLFMYIMQDSNPTRKGDEPWTRREGSRRAEQLFMVMGFAHRPAPKPFSPAIYKQPNPDGLLAYAQAMIYNANEQTGSGPSGYQPQVGWDTLNWKYPVDQSLAYEFEQGNRSDSGGSWSQALNFLHPTSSQNPVIALNWQAKLVPVTRLEEARNSALLPGSIRKVLRKTPDVPGLTNH